MDHFPPLFDLRFARLKEGLPRFNEFSDRYAELTPENKALYAQERAALLRAWHGGALPEGVETRAFAYQNGAYAGAGTVYRPAGAEGLLPGALFIHGGGWTTLSKECYAYECAAFARKGRVAVVAIDYRMAPEHPFPAAAEDCYAALLRLYDTAEALGIDRERLAVMGDSAGGNLAAVLPVMARDRQGPRLSAQILCYPAGDLRPQAERMGRGRGLSYLAEAHDATNIYASPILTDLTGMPDTLIIVGTCDFLFDDNRRFAAALRRAGVEVDLVVYEGLPHGFIQMANEYGQDAVNTICAKLREKFHGETPQQTQSALFAYPFRQALAGLPAFNEFGDTYAAHTPENLRAYQAERARLLRSWRGEDDLSGVRVLPFACKNGEATVLCDVYIPLDKAERAPVALYIHGGGDTLTKALYAHECACFARDGHSVVLAVEYRMRDNSACPDAMEDVYAALCAFCERAAEYGADGARVALMGDSLGGNIAIAVAKLARDRRHPTVALQVLLYPRTLLTPSLYASHEFRYDPRLASHPLASPYNGDLRGLPETLIIVGSADFMLDDNLYFARKLTDSGVKTDFKLYQGMPHGFIQMQNEQAADARAAVCQKLMDVLGATPV